MITPRKHIEVNHKAISNHLIYKVEVSRPNHILIAIGGIHGNEKAGVKALKEVFDIISTSQMQFKGNFYGFFGNLSALHENVRYQDVDFNRIWTSANVFTKDGKHHAEAKEQQQLYNAFKTIVNNSKVPVTFLDLHTTSASTVPFITISDSLNNRSFAAGFNLPIVLGIEEYLNGALLSFLNEYGYRAIGFEGGQHYDEMAVKNCTAFIWQSLVKLKIINSNQLSDYERYKELLYVTVKPVFYQINYKYHIAPLENFIMHSGFVNFQKVQKNQPLATSNGRLIKAKKKGYIFMPLYQKKGEDGFFIITKISIIWLWLSKLLRILNFNTLLLLLPGVKRQNGSSNVIEVNIKTAKVLAKDILHLFGYRHKTRVEELWLFSKRDRKIKKLP